MNLFGKIAQDVTTSYCAMNGFPHPTKPGVNDFFRKASEVSRESRGIPVNKYQVGPVVRGDELYDETDSASIAYQWMRRCQLSEDEALSVMSEIEITEHGDFIKKALHLLSSVGLYSDRNKIVNELVESLEGTLLACARNE